MLSNNEQIFLGYAKGAFNSFITRKDPRRSNPKLPYDDPTEQAYYKHQRECNEVCKEWIKDAIREWLKDNGMTGFITIDGMGSFYGETKLPINGITIHNGVGSVVKANNWMNKIIVIKDQFNKWSVRSHKVTTDITYLHPADDKFLAFIEEMDAFLRE